MAIAGLLLAAGASRRLGTPKQLLPGADGVPLVAVAARQLLDAGCAPVLVVLGADAEAIGAAVASLPVTCVVNADWASGMGHSIAAGVAALGDTRNAPLNAAPHDTASVEGVMIMACDMPAVTTAHLAALMAAAEGGQRAASAYGRADGAVVRGIPAVLPRADWAWLQTLTGDQGAREVLRREDTRTVFLEHGALDLDTVDDVDRWRAGGAGHQVSTLAPSSRPSRLLTMSMMAKSVLADLDHEMASTRTMLARIPAAHLDYTPHAKSWTLRKLATHLLDFPMWGQVTLQTTTLDFAAPQPPKPVLNSTEDFLAVWDERVAGFKAALDAASDADLQVTWTATVGAQVVMSMPRIAVLRGMVINHMIHHRAQLSIYFRMLDVPLPPTYGPTADES